MVNSYLIPGVSTAIFHSNGIGMTGPMIGICIAGKSDESANNLFCDILTSGSIQNDDLKVEQCHHD